MGIGRKATIWSDREAILGWLSLNCFSIVCAMDITWRRSPRQSVADWRSLREMSIHRAACPTVMKVESAVCPTESSLSVDSFVHMHKERFSLRYPGEKVGKVDKAVTPSCGCHLSFRVMTSGWGSVTVVRNCDTHQLKSPYFREEDH